MRDDWKWFRGWLRNAPDTSRYIERMSRPGALTAGLNWYRASNVRPAGAAPLVVSVHSIVGMDFAEAIVPGWHSTIFPPYFVAGAIFSGFAMVIALAIPFRAVYKLHDFITARHLENCAILMLVTGLLVATGVAQGWGRAADVATVVTALAVAVLAVPLIVAAAGLRTVAAQPVKRRIQCLVVVKVGVLCDLDDEPTCRDVGDEFVEPWRRDARR